MKKIIFLIIFCISFMFSINIVFADCYRICKNNNCNYYTESPYANKECWQYDGSKYELGTLDGSTHCKNPDNCKNVSILYCANSVGETIEKVSDESLCKDAKEKSTYDNDKNKVSCGSIGSFNKKIPELTSWGFTIVQVVVPVILVILGIVDFVKALTSQKDDEIKKGQQIFIKRLITGILIFFVVVIVKLVVSLLASSSRESNNILNCIDCFLSNKCN